MIKYSVNYIVCLFILCMFCSYSNSFDNDDISWQKDVLLKQEDFQGTTDTLSLSAALSEVHIKVDEPKWVENKFSCKVYSCFNKKNSWFKKDKFNSYILNHEQKHFDIEEAFARKLRKEILQNKYTKNNLHDKLSKIYQDVVKECNDLQDKYDDETNHSQIVLKQQEWNIKIEDMLKKYEKFSSTQIEITVKN